MIDSCFRVKEYIKAALNSIFSIINDGNKFLEKIFNLTCSKNDLEELINLLGLEIVEILVNICYQIKKFELLLQYFSILDVNKIQENSDLFKANIKQLLNFNKINDATMLEAYNKNLNQYINKQKLLLINLLEIKEKINNPIACLSSLRELIMLYSKYHLTLIQSEVLLYGSKSIENYTLHKNDPRKLLLEKYITIMHDFYKESLPELYYINLSNVMISMLNENNFFLKMYIKKNLKSSISFFELRTSENYFNNKHNHDFNCSFLLGKYHFFIGLQLSNDENEAKENLVYASKYFSKELGNKAEILDNLRVFIKNNNL